LHWPVAPRFIERASGMPGLTAKAKLKSGNRRKTAHRVAAVRTRKTIHFHLGFPETLKEVG